MLSGFEHLPRQGLGAFTRGGKKLLLHTTEGRSTSGAIATLDKNRSWSHFLLNFEEKRKIQFIEIGQTAKSLSNNTSDGFETNRANCVQVEICGYAGEAGSWSNAKLDWLTECFREIRSAWDFPLTTTGKGRMSDKAFVDYAGICEHRNCPDNDHWDCGDLNVQYIANKLGATMSADKLTKEEVIVLHEAEFGGLPGSAYDYRHVGGTLGKLLADWHESPHTLRNQKNAGILINKKDCPSTPSTIDIDALAEAVADKLAERLKE